LAPDNLEQAFALYSFLKVEREGNLSEAAHSINIESLWDGQGFVGRLVFLLLRAFEGRLKY
jgi:hypothetical protein